MSLTGAGRRAVGQAPSNDASPTSSPKILSTYLATQVPTAPSPQEEAWRTWYTTCSVFDRSKRRRRPAVQDDSRGDSLSPHGDEDSQQENRPGTTNSSDIIAETCCELKNLYNSYSTVNRFFIPISQVPPRGLELKQFVGKPPSCTPDLSVPRAERLMGRWQSMPRLPSQLPDDQLQHIRRAMRPSAGDQLLEENSAAVQALERGIAVRQSRGGRRPPWMGSPAARSAKLVRGTSYLRALPEYDGGGGKHTGLHIKCTCCDHPALPDAAAK